MLKKSQRLTDMAIDKVALVPKGANGRTFAVLKQDVPVSKAPATFVERMQLLGLGDFLPGALDTLSTVLYDITYAAGDYTPEQRADAAIMAVDQFRDALLARIAGAIVKARPTPGPRTVPTRKASAADPFRGVL
jgi:hypothetical protein